MSEYIPKYVKVIDGTYAGWRGYVTGMYTDTGTPKLRLYDGRGHERTIAVREKNFMYILPK